MAALLTMLLIYTAPAQEGVNEPDGWFGVGVGLFSVDVQVGYYDLLAKRLNGRLVASYAFEGAFAVNADLLFSTGRPSGFFFGLGPGLLLAPYLSPGANVVIGGDIPLDSQSGILIDGGLGLYPYFPIYADGDVPGMIFPFFARLSVGYRYSF